MSSLSLRCTSPGVAEGWADVPHDCLVAIIERFSSKNDAAVSRSSSSSGELPPPQQQQQGVQTCEHMQW